MQTQFKKSFMKPDEPVVINHPIDFPALILILRKMEQAHTTGEFFLTLYENGVCELSKITGKMTTEPVTEFK
jgi:hypothetical protein